MSTCMTHIEDKSCNDQWRLGYDAGFRGDELVTEKDKCYMAGYEGGQTAKMLESMGTNVSSSS